MAGTGRHCTVVAVLLALMVLVSSAPAVELLSNRAVPQADGATLLVFTFDAPIQSRMITEEGRSLVLAVDSLRFPAYQPESGGLIKSIVVADTTITIRATKTVHAVRFPAGAGVIVLEVRPGLIPDPNAPAKRVVQRSRPKAKPKPEPVPVELDTSLSMFYTKQFPPRIEAIRDLYEQGYKDQAFDSLLSFPVDDSLYGWSRVLWGDLLVFNRKFAQSLTPYGEALGFHRTQEIASIKMAMVYQLLENDSLAGVMWEKALAYIAMRDSLPAEATSEPDEVEKAGGGGGFPWMTVIIIAGVLGLLAGGFFLVRYLQDRKMKKMMALLDEEEGLYASEEPTQTGFKEGEIVDDFADDMVQFDDEPDVEMEDDSVGAGKRVADLYQEQDDHLASELEMWNQGSEPKEKPQFTWKTGAGEMPLDEISHDFSKEEAVPPPGKQQAATPKMQDDIFEDESPRGEEPADEFFEDEPEPAPKPKPKQPEPDPTMASWDLEDDADAGLPQENTRERIVELHRDGVSVREIAEQLRMGQDEVKTILNIAGETVNA